MSFNAIAAQLREDFTYLSDRQQFGEKEHWRIGPESGPFKGDCDDLVTTALFRICLGNEPAFWEALNTGVAKVHRVEVESRQTPGLWFGHVILEYEGAGFICTLEPTLTWRGSRDFNDRNIRFDRIYSTSDIRRKLAGKKVYDGKKFGMVALIGLCVLGLIAFGGVGGLF